MTEPTDDTLVELTSAINGLAAELETYRRHVLPPFREELLQLKRSIETLSENLGEQ